MAKHCLSLLLWCCCVLSGSAQTPLYKVTVDACLSVTFPAPVTHFDSEGIDVFQATADQTTYQVINQPQMFDEADAKKRVRLMDEGSRRMMENPKFDGMDKQIKDSVIGGSIGRFIQIRKHGQSNPYFVFIFLTIRGTDMYSLQCVSFKPEAGAQAAARNFYKSVFFQGPQRLPVKP